MFCYQITRPVQVFIERQIKKDKIICKYDRSNVDIPNVDTFQVIVMASNISISVEIMDDEDYFVHLPGGQTKTRLMPETLTQVEVNVKVHTIARLLWL